MTGCLKSKLIRLSAVLLVVQMAATAGAALTYLPESSHYSGGVSYFMKSAGTGSVVKGRVEFTVYDTVANPNEFTGLGGVPGTGRYLYAYQVFVDSTNVYSLTNVAMNYFSVKGLGAGAAAVSKVSHGEQYGTGGENPTNEYMTETKAAWEFSQGVSPSKNSVLLLIRSERDYKSGTYAVVKPENEDDIIGPGEGDDAGSDNDNNIPEPASLLVLGAGSLLLGRFRKQG